jgi:hypothetical protein
MTTLSGRRGIMGAVLLAIVAVLATVSTALAGPAAATPEDSPRTGTLVWSPAGVDEHKCVNFGSTVQGYRAGHCVEFQSFTNSAGKLAFRGGAQTFCQRASDGVIVRCAGINHTIAITDKTDQSSESVGFKCGRFGSVACPTGRFSHLSPGLPCVFGHVYFATIASLVSLPVSGSNTPVQWTNSSEFIGTCV